MARDPYSVLGLSNTATADEVKRAYRALAKKYHPDLNPGDKQAEQKMKEINEAYDVIVNNKYNPNAYSSSSGAYGGTGAGYSAGQSYGGYQRGYADPFSGFGFDFGGFGGQRQSSRQYAGRADETSDLRAARNYINSGRYYEAINILNSIANRDAYWYFLSALANEGAGNRINALNYAKTAASMEPDNADYADLAARLQYMGGANEFYGRNFRMPNIASFNFLWCCFASLFCRSCFWC